MTLYYTSYVYVFHTITKDTLSAGHYSELCATPVPKKLPNCSTRKDLSIASHSQSVPLESLRKEQKTCKDCGKSLPVITNLSIRLC